LHIQQSIVNLLHIYKVLK